MESGFIYMGIDIQTIHCEVPVRPLLDINHSVAIVHVPAFIPR